MEFELKRFFREDSCPRFRDDIKTAIYAFATRMVHKIAHYMHNFRIVRLLPRHVPYLIFQLCQDPHTLILRNGDVQSHRSRIKDLSKILANVLEDVETEVANTKNGNIDRKIVKGVLDILRSVKLDSTQKAAVMVAACVAEVCGIILNTAYQAEKCPKTLNEQILWKSGTTHILSTGEECTNISLVRFIFMLQRADTLALINNNSHTEERKRFEVPEEKMVSFKRST